MLLFAPSFRLLSYHPTNKFQTKIPKVFGRDGENYAENIKRVEVNNKSIQFKEKHALFPQTQFAIRDLAKIRTLGQDSYRLPVVSRV